MITLARSTRIIRIVRLLRLVRMQEIMANAARRPWNRFRSTGRHPKSLGKTCENH